MLTFAATSATECTISWLDLKRVEIKHVSPGPTTICVTCVCVDQDPIAGIKTYPNCVRLVDLHGDGDDKLLIADYERKLRVYKGTSMISEHTLLDHPCAIAVFYSDMNNPRTPAVAVGSGPNVYIYRNLRPYYKFTVPPVELHATELECWALLKKGLSVLPQCLVRLAEARDVHGVRPHPRPTYIV